MEASTEQPRRRGFTMSEVAMASVNRQPAQAKPHFGVNRVKGVGGQLLIEWDVDIPVCDEFPTADDAFQATIEYGKRFEYEFPAPSMNGNGS